MWENERKKTFNRNATIFLLLIIVVIGLLVAMSAVKKQVKAEKEVEEANMTLRAFLFERVYSDETFRREEERADRMISALYGFFKNHVDKMPDFYVGLLDKYDIDTVICDYISSMSDGYAIKIFSDYYIPDNWKL